MGDTSSFESWIFLDLVGSFIALYMGPTCWIKVCAPIYGTYVLDQGVCPYIWDLCAGSSCVPLYMGPLYINKNPIKKGV